MVVIYARMLILNYLLKFGKTKSISKIKGLAKLAGLQVERFMFFE